MLAFSVNFDLLSVISIVFSVNFDLLCVINIAFSVNFDLLSGCVISIVFFGEF